MQKVMESCGILKSSKSTNPALVPTEQTSLRKQLLKINNQLFSKSAKCKIIY